MNIYHKELIKKYKQFLELEEQSKGLKDIEEMVVNFRRLLENCLRQEIMQFIIQWKHNIPFNLQNLKQIFNKNIPDKLEQSQVDELLRDTKETTLKMQNEIDKEANDESYPFNLVGAKIVLQMTEEQASKHIVGYKSE